MIRIGDYVAFQSRSSGERSMKAYNKLRGIVAEGPRINRGHSEYRVIWDKVTSHWRQDGCRTVIYIGDLVEWRDQRNYPGLCGIVTNICQETPPEIFVHWLIFPHDYPVGEGWEKQQDVRRLSPAGTTK